MGVRLRCECAVIETCIAISPGSGGGYDLQRCGTRGSTGEHPVQLHADWRTLRDGKPVPSLANGANGDGAVCE